MFFLCILIYITSLNHSSGWLLYHKIIVYNIYSLTEKTFHTKNCMLY